MTGVARALIPAATAPDAGTEPAPAPPGALIRAVPSPAAPPVPPRTEASEQVSAPDVPVDGREAATGRPRADASAVQPGDPRPRRSDAGPGRRELRRRETRARIVDAAAALFAERGFDAVSVVEIAQRAGVVEKTVFNHFPVKEGLVFETEPPVREALLDAVRRRPAGESASAAAGSFVVAAVSLLGTPEAADGVAEMAKVIRGSRTLQVREREILGDLTEALARLIAEETGGTTGRLEPWLTAHAVLGLYARLLELARDRVLAGVTGAELAAELRASGQRGLALLQFGLAGYAKRR